MGDIELNERLKDDDSGDHEQDQGSPKDSEKEKPEEDDKEQNIIKKKMVVPGPGEHPLQYNYTFWYSRRTPGRPASTQSYEQNIKQIGSFASVEQFWRFYSHMIRPGDLTGHSDFHLFKEGIKPMWEDDANKMGGKWIIRLRKGLASRCWENLILAMLGEQFMVGEEICGAVVSVRFQEDIISIWNKTASDQATTARIRDTLRRVLNLPPNTIMEYKTHTDSIKFMCLRGVLRGGRVQGWIPLRGSALCNMRTEEISTGTEGLKTIPCFCPVLMFERKDAPAIGKAKRNNQSAGERSLHYSCLQFVRKSNSAQYVVATEGAAGALNLDSGGSLRAADLQERGKHAPPDHTIRQHTSNEQPGRNMAQFFTRSQLLYNQTELGEYALISIRQQPKQQASTLRGLSKSGLAVTCICLTVSNTDKNCSPASSLRSCSSSSSVFGAGGCMRVFQVRRHSVGLGVFHLSLALAGRPASILESPEDALDVLLSLKVITSIYLLITSFLDPSEEWPPNSIMLPPPCLFGDDVLREEFSVDLMTTCVCVTIHVANALLCVCGSLDVSRQLSLSAGVRFHLNQPDPPFVALEKRHSAMKLKSGSQRWVDDAWHTFKDVGTVALSYDPDAAVRVQFA
ncbi:hypothetical protein CCH79_00005236 [Gambusia affinis]|uniref:Eukaryotic translation initiation factor 4E type 2 n=1 Tax=Gambusia affinis TaxID=33528 RepID=A0A315VRZ0_GAMAF|nr:hypothetical protein CCH79_00005236 [Gambusia affinis]